MKKNKSIIIFENEPVRRIWSDKEERWYFSVVDIIRILTESANPRKYWSVLKTRLRQEGSQSATNCSQLKMPAIRERILKN